MNKKELLDAIRDILVRNIDQKLTIELANGIYGILEVKVNELSNSSNTKR